MYGYHLVMYEHWNICVQSFFRNEKGEHVTTHKSDVWSTCVTMMNVLIGIAVNDEAQKEV